MVRRAVFLAMSLPALGAASPPAASPLEAWQRCMTTPGEAGIAACTAAIEKGEALPDAYFNRGLAYRRSDRLSQAIADYDMALRLRPDFAAALTNRGAAYALDHRPDLAEAVNNRALTWHRLGRYDLAKADFDRTIRLRQFFGNALIARTLGAIEAGPRPRP